MVTFIFTNPRHHVDLMAPVARELSERGVATRFLSLAELRGMKPPADLASRVPGAVIESIVPPRERKDPSEQTGIGSSTSFVRRIARRAVWAGWVAPQIRRLVRRDDDVVVIPNDTAWPYGSLAKSLRKRGIPLALIQEGIRFPVPCETDAGAPYGGSGAVVCAWGEGSAEHFRKYAGPRSVVVTGNPRFDDVDPSAWTEKGAALLARLGLTQRPLLLLTNPIDDQGFCTREQKMELFRAFVHGVAPYLAREGRALVTKHHPREDVAAYKAIVDEVQGVEVRVLGDESIWAVLAAGHAVVVQASTAGLEAIAFGLPLGVLSIPGHGHVFEYVQRGAAVGIDVDRLDDSVPRLLAGGVDRDAAGGLLERHMAHRGEAARRVAERLIELEQGRGE